MASRQGGRSAPGQRRRPARSPGGRARLRRLVPVGAAVRAASLPTPEDAHLSAHRDAAGRPEPDRLGGVPTGRSRGRSGAAERLRDAAVALAQNGGGVEPGQGLLAWLGCHNRAYERLAGVAAVNRIDNVKTALAQGAGPWGTIHPAYKAYSRAVGFHVDACLPRDPEAKGKAEAGVRLSRLLLDPTGRRFDGLEDLQQRSDQRLERWAKKALCPATGRTVEASWEAELERLAPLPLLPEPFDLAVTRPVHKDCMVRFEQRSYAVPFPWVGRRVEVRGCAGKVQILAEGRVLCEYPRHTAERILIDPSCYEGEATDRVEPPRPLGKMAQRLQQIYEQSVEQRPLDLYAALAEVAR